MSLIHIALQEGFQNQKVDAYLNGETKPVYSKIEVRTRMQKGFADIFDIDAETGVNLLLIEVENPESNVKVPIKKEIPIKITDRELYVRISLTPDDQISHNINEEPFRYA